MTDLTNSTDTNGVTPPADGVTPPVTPPAGGAPADGAPVDPPAGDPPAGDAPAGDDDGLSSALTGDLDPNAPPAGEEPPAAPVVPEAYDVGTLEGFDVDPEALTEATPIFKEAGLTNEQATKLMPAAKAFAERTQTQVTQQIMDMAMEQRKGWLKEAKAAEDIGGAKFDETLHVAAKGMDAMGFVKDHPFRKALAETGFGNHPDMIRVFQKLGSLVSEDGLVIGNPVTSGGKKDKASVWYGGDQK